MYYLAMDGGGTKLIGLLFDEQYRLIRAARTGGTHASVYPPQEIRTHIADCYATLFADLPRPLALERLYVICGNVDLFVELLPDFITPGRTCVLSEGVAGLYAGTGRHSGFVALAGTGSDVFYIRDDRTVDTVGGWGAILGDEGSGVWMARMAMQVAIRAEQGWGEPTVFGELVKEHYRLPHLWDYVPYLYDTPAPFRRLGELLPLVAIAAHAGDTLMLDIFRQGGCMMARQMAALLDRYPEDEPCIVACGGAWKAHPAMAASFRETLAVNHPLARFSLPRFEHIMAGPICLAMEHGEADDTLPDRLTLGFPDFVWNACGPTPLTRKDGASV